MANVVINVSQTIQEVAINQTDNTVKVFVNINPNRIIGGTFSDNGDLTTPSTYNLVFGSLGIMLGDYTVSLTALNPDSSILLAENYWITEKKINMCTINFNLVYTTLIEMDFTITPHT